MTYSLLWQDAVMSHTMTYMSHVSYLCVSCLMSGVGTTRPHCKEVVEGLMSLYILSHIFATHEIFATSCLVLSSIFCLVSRYLHVLYRHDPFHDFATHESVDV
jgi:hypothetical protein